MSEGWRCPGCGKCYSPYMFECTQCGKYGSWSYDGTTVTWILCGKCGRYHQSGQPCENSSAGLTVRDTPML